MKEREHASVEAPGAEKAVAEHRECMSVVARVEDCLDRQPDLEGVWLRRLRDALPPLLETLRCHFSEEQESPLYRTLPVAKPRYADRLRKLAGEHAAILASVQKVIDRGDALEGPDTELHALREYDAQVQLLVATIRRHEAEENEILLGAHWDEVGTGD